MFARKSVIQLLILSIVFGLTTYDGIGQTQKLPETFETESIYQCSEQTVLFVKYRIVYNEQFMAFKLENTSNILWYHKNGWAHRYLILQSKIFNNILPSKNHYLKRIYQKEDSLEDNIKVS